MKPRLFSNKLKQNPKPPIENELLHYLQIYKYINKNYYQETVF